MLPKRLRWLSALIGGDNLLLPFVWCSVVSQKLTPMHSFTVTD